MDPSELPKQKKCHSCGSFQALDQFVHARSHLPTVNCLTCRISNRRKRPACEALSPLQPARVPNEARLLPEPRPDFARALTERFLADGLAPEAAESRARATAAQSHIRREHRQERRDGAEPSQTPSLNTLEAPFRFNDPVVDTGSVRPRGRPRVNQQGLDTESVRPRGRPCVNYQAPTLEAVDEVSATQRGNPHDTRRVLALEPEGSIFDRDPCQFNNNLDASALSEVDRVAVIDFHNALEADSRDLCSRCKEYWFNLKVNDDGICQNCVTRDNKKREDEPYIFSRENKLDFGDAPSLLGLPQLTMVEELLIARVHVAIQVHQVRGQQYKYRGHVVHFMRNVGKVYNLLPLLPKNLSIVLLRPPVSARNERQDAQFRKRFLVRRANIERWLEFLQHNHTGYRYFEWNRAALESLPENGDILDQVNIEEANMPETGTLPQGPAEEDEDWDPEAEDHAVVPNIALEHTELERLQAEVDGERIPDDLLAEIARPEDAHHLPLPTLRNTPINEFDNSATLFSLAFPTLFPRGEAEFKYPRERKVTLDEWVKHAMRWHDGRFARHPTFRFVCLNMLMRHQAFAASRYYVKKNGGRNERVTREDLQRALATPDSDEAKALLKSISRSGNKLKGTRPFWFAKRRECESFAYNLGVPSAFITLSPADLHWRSLYQHMPRFEEWLALPEMERMRLSRVLLRENPHIAAWHFYSRNKLLRVHILSKRFGMRDFWVRFEWQSRGSSHTHGLYWLLNSPLADMSDDRTRAVFAHRWSCVVTAFNPEPLRRQDQDEGNLLTSRTQDHPTDFRRLSQLVNRCQRHKCSGTYCLVVNKRDAQRARERGEPAPAPSCRFYFPRQMRDHAEMVKPPGKRYWHYEGARNDEILNQYNATLALAWLANTDFSPCTSVDAVINYAAKYCSKAETKTASFGDLAREILPRIASSNCMMSFTSKLLNKLIGERDISAQEVCHLLLGLPLQEDSRVVRVVDCRPLAEQRNVLELGSEEAGERENAYRKYLARDLSVPALRDLTFFHLNEMWNFNKRNSAEWSTYSRGAKERVLDYIPRYNSSRDSAQYTDFCRVKLMLNHPHSDEAELLRVDGEDFDDYESAYAYCKVRHQHPNDHYGVEVPPEEEEDEPVHGEVEDGPVEEDWLDLARMLPDRAMTQESLDLIGVRDIDMVYDWSSHVGKYDHEDFKDGRYWKNLASANPGPEPVYVSLSACDTLNRAQRIAYDTVIGHSQTTLPPQLLLQADGGGGTGKSHLIKILAAHLLSRGEVEAE